MSSSSLTAKYRPQTFTDVAGQESIKAILSRAALEDKVAPAYLFSGTRGVGKTTLARIFAKAMNCSAAPCAEPCNNCVQCRQITAGNSVDVIEIDAASNRGIEHARKLKEDIGYAPLDGRYKVFIIDEAHMLTREAFNALLKTLEEPPPRVTFIMATTEPHKFPATIISRSQHYVFKRLTQSQLVAHLENILNMEKMEYEPGAVSLIAKRGSGSVRDSMSLLGQVLALGGDYLNEADVREVLGLAGQEFFFKLIGAISESDIAGIGDMVSEILDQGLDLGFFMRELATCWRNMFILSKTGDAGLDMLALPSEDAAAWKGWAGKFQLTHLHACWQMTLEGQKRVLDSLEPAQSLELLLLNLAHLPMLVDFNQFTRLMKATTVETGAMPQMQAGRAGGFQPQGNFSPPPAGNYTPRQQSAPPQGQIDYGRPQSAPQAQVHGGTMAPAQAPRPPKAAQAPATTQAPRAPQAPKAPAQSQAPRAPRPPQGGQPQKAPRAPRPPQGGNEPPQMPGDDQGGSGPEPGHDPTPAPQGAAPMDMAPQSWGNEGPAGNEPPMASSPDAFDSLPSAKAPGRPDPSKAPRPPESVGQQPVATAKPIGRPKAVPANIQKLPEPSGERDWAGFLNYMEQAAESGIEIPSQAKRARGEISGSTLVMNCHSKVHGDQVQADGRYENFVSLAERFFGEGIEITFACKDSVALKTNEELNRDMEKHPLITRFMDDFGARIDGIKQASIKDK